MAKIDQINVGVIGVGWVGGIRATACKKNPVIDKLYIAEIDKNRQTELKKELKPDVITDNWKDLVDNDDVDAVVISMTPETKRFPLVMECLEKVNMYLLKSRLLQRSKKLMKLCSLPKKII
jgi:predicted dehydrogenase